MPAKQYPEARQVIQDGDIIFFHGLWRDPIQAVIMFVTQSVFSHCAIAFWVDTPVGRKLLCVEAQGKTRRRILSLSYYDDLEMTIMEAPRPWSEVKEKALADVGKARYGMLHAIYVGLSEFCQRVTKIKLPQSNLMDEFCSRFCADVYDLPDKKVSPQTLYEQLQQITRER